MDITTLPFDAEEMLACLRPWIECESPTWDAAAVNRVMDLASYDLATMGARIERISGRFRQSTHSASQIARQDRFSRQTWTC